MHGNYEAKSVSEPWLVGLSSFDLSTHKRAAAKFKIESNNLISFCKIIEKQTAAHVIWVKKCRVWQIFVEGLKDFPKTNHFIPSKTNTSTH